MSSRNCALGVLILCWFVGSCLANTFGEPYNCYGDVCNEGSDAQFCDEVLRHCRLCDEVRDDCFARQHTCNCSQFCSEYKSRQDVDKLRVLGCQVPPPPEHGWFDVNTTTVPLGSTLAVICDAEYTVRNEHPMSCSNFSTWTGSPPTCEGSQTDWKNYALIAFGGVFGLTFVINIICVVQRHWSKCAFKRKQEWSRADSELQPLNDRNKKEIVSQADTNQHDTHRSLPSAHPMQTGTDVEGGLNSGDCRHYTNKASQTDKGHLSSTNINNEQETSRIKNSSHASDGNTPHEETAKDNNQEHDTKPTPHNSCDHHNCNMNLTVNNIVTGTLEPTNQSLKKPDGVAKQPDNLSNPVSDQMDSKYIPKSMGGSIPDASTKGPVTQPVDEGFGSWDNPSQ